MQAYINHVPRRGAPPRNQLPAKLGGTSEHVMNDNYESMPKAGDGNDEPVPAAQHESTLRQR